MCCGTRVCQCLPVSTPTYLCKSFNLTPPACRAYPERDRISKPIRIHCLDGGERVAPRRTAPLDPQQPYDRVSLVGYRRLCLYRRKVLRHAYVTRVVAPKEIPAVIDVPLIRPRGHNTYMIHAYSGLRRDWKKCVDSFLLQFYSRIYSRKKISSSRWRITHTHTHTKHTRTHAQFAQFFKLNLI